MAETKNERRSLHIMLDNLDLTNFIRNNEKNVVINVTLEQLLQFGKKIAEDAVNTAMDKQKERLLSRTEVIEMFGISSTTLWRWQEYGYVKYRRIGNRNYYPEYEIRKMIQS
ncbi:MAG: hypothetical protein ABFS32_14430 [Bacteroidota bacterium]